MNDGSTQWSVELNNMIPENIWKNIGFTWSQTDGLTVSALRELKKTKSKVI